MLSQLYYIFLCSLLFLSISLFQSKISTEQYNSLYDLYESTNGQWWTWNQSRTSSPIPTSEWKFDGSSDPCEDNWEGIVCNIGDDIVSLSLLNKNMTGILPSTIGTFSALSVFTIANSPRLNGPIPSTITNLTNLNVLQLVRVLISGTIPSDIAKLHLLIDLQFSNTRIQYKVPSGLINLTALQILQFDNNFLTGHFAFPLYELKDLRYLDISNNLFSGPLSVYCDSYNLESSKLTFVDMSHNIFHLLLVDSSYQCLRAIEYINYADNYFNQSLPVNIFNLTSLKHLDLSRNSFHGSIPTDSYSLLSLEYFHVSVNFITGFIPSVFSASGNLTSFDIGNNELKGQIPSYLGNLEKLTLFRCILNYFDGKLPDNLGKLTNLKVLEVAGNSFSGKIPTFIQKLQQLNNLALGSNLFTGSISPELTLLTNLTHLGLAQNQLKGPLPSDFGKLSTLRTLFIFGNQFSQSIPSSFSQLVNLNYAYCSGNQFTSSLPNELFAGMKELREISFSSNKLTGSIPSMLGMPSVITRIDLSGNNFIGKIPRNIWEHSFLQSLYLSKNKLYDEMPNNFTTRQNLIEIDLSHNQFYGTIPSSLVNLRYARRIGLKLLRLEDNAFKGTIPMSLLTLKSIETLILHSNHLTGSLPKSTWDNNNITLSEYQMEVFDVSHNELTGTIPPKLFTVLPLLRTLVLSQNCFSGELPDSICNCSNLENLFMSGLASGSNCPQQPILEIFANSMQGHIPSCFFYLPKLQQLYLSGNGLEGTIANEIHDDNGHVLMPQLTSLNLNYNHLSGSIPWMTLVALDLFEVDLSHNKFFGNLPSVDLNVESKLILYDNRFSGFVSYIKSEEVHVLFGNLFDCNKANGKPENDENRDEIVCASVQLVNESIICGSLVFAVALIVFAILFWWRISSRLRRHKKGNLRAEIRRTYHNRSSLAVDEMSSSKIIIESFKLLIENVKLWLLIDRLLREEFSRDRSMGRSTLSSMSNLTISSKPHSDRESRLSPHSNSRKSPTGDREPDLSLSINPLYKMRNTKTRIEFENSSSKEQVSLESDSKESYEDYFRNTTAAMRRSSIVDDNELIIRLGGSNDVVTDLWSPNNLFYMRSVRMYLRVLHYLGQTCLLICLCIVMVAIPTYLLLKKGTRWEDTIYSTHSDQYAWLASGAYLSGLLPANILTSYIIGLLIILLYALLKSYSTMHRDYKSDKKLYNLTSRQPKPPENSDGAAANDNGGGDLHSTRSTAIRYGLMIFDYIVILGVNISYIVVIEYYSSTYVKVLCHIGLASFGIFWSQVVLPSLITWISQFGTYTSVEKAHLLMVISIFNGLIAPCLATLGTHTSCFYNNIFGTETVESSYNFTTYTYDYCSVLTQKCVVTGISQYESSFDPPPMYNYQCSSAIITSYVPVLFYMNTFNALLTPVALCLLSQVDPASFPTWISRRLPWIVWPLEDTRKGWNLLRPEVTVAILQTNIVVLVTFGLACPLLAVVITVAVLCKVYFWKIFIIRFVDTCHRQKFLETPSTAGDGSYGGINMLNLESVCWKIWKVPKRCLIAILVSALLFNCTFVADIAGDRIGRLAYFSYPPAFFGCGILFVIVYYTYIKYTHALQIDIKKEMFKDMFRSNHGSGGRSTRERLTELSIISSPVHMT